MKKAMPRRRPRENAMMSRNRVQRPSPPTSIGWLLLVALAGAPLAACNGDEAFSEGGAPGDRTNLHPIVLADAPTILDVYAAGGGLDALTVAKIRSFADRYRALGGGRVAILTPAGVVGRHSRAVDEIRRVLASAGLRGGVSVASYPAGDPTQAAPVRLIFQGLKAEVATPCGQWPSDLASGSSTEGWKNDAYENFGCATQASLAAQVDDPRDFVQARASDAPEVGMRLRAIGDVRDGKDPGTNWATKLTPIGQVGGGG
jgi:pilus assembly protein CpaD